MFAPMTIPQVADALIDQAWSQEVGSTHPKSQTERGSRVNARTGGNHCWGTEGPLLTYGMATRPKEWATGCLSLWLHHLHLPSEVKFIFERPHVLGAFYSGSLLVGLLLTQFSKPPTSVVPFVHPSYPED